MNKKRPITLLLSIFGFNEFKHITKETLIVEGICVLVFFPAINFFLNQILQTYFSFSSVSALFYITMAIFGLYSYSFFFKSGPAVAIIAFLVFLSTLFSYLFYPEISKIFINEDFNPLTSAFLGILFYQIPALILASNLKRYDFLIKRARLYSLITVIVGIISFYYFTIVSASEDIPNYMVYSYNLLSGLGPLIVLAYYDRNLIYAIPIALGAICMLVVGARGAQMSLLLIVLFSIIAFSKNRAKTISGILVLLFICMFAISHIDILADGIDKLLGDYNVHSRTLAKMMEGSFFSQSGRDKLRDIVIEGISNRPFFGYGLFGDRYVTATMGWGEPAYCHNLFLELCCDMGIVLGSLAFLFIVISLIRNIISHNRNKKAAILVCMSCGFFELLFSNSYLLSIPFFCLLGFFLNVKKQMCISPNK